MNVKNFPLEYQEILKRLQNLEDIVGVAESGDHQDQLEAQTTEDLSIESRVSVVIKAKAYLKLALHALKYANDNIAADKWVEVIGVLTGSLQNEETPVEQVVVEDYWPVGSGDAVSVNILEADPIMDILASKPTQDFIVGWAHSHPSYSPFLSQDDVNTQLRYQALWEESIALVIDPILITKKSFGFGIFRIATDRQSYYELDYDVEGLNEKTAYDVLSLMLSELQQD